MGRVVRAKEKERVHSLHLDSLDVAGQTLPVTKVLAFQGYCLKPFRN